MKKWIIVQAVMVVAIIFLGWQIKIQLTPAAQTAVSQKSGFELFVQTENGLVPYSQVAIIKVDLVEEFTDEQIEKTEQLIFSHRQDIQIQICELEPALGETLIQLAHCESSLNPLAVGDNGNSHGLFQIFLKWHPDVTQSQAQDIEFATRWTANKIRQGQGHLWTCWNKI